MTEESARDPRLDHPVAVREGEELDEPALAAYLRAQGLTEAGSIDIAQFPRGFSNLTYLVTAGNRGWILRRPPFGIGRGVAHDYLMARATGIILRDRLPAGLSLDAAEMRRVSECVVDTLAEIHGVDYASAGLSELGHPEGYARRQVEGWTRRYVAARTGDQPELEALAEWLAESIPESSRAALLHNDFKYDNLVLDSADPSRVVAVLDWEMATIGDPLMDLGTSLAYWVEAGDPPALRALGLGVTTIEGNLTREEVVARYEAATGRAVDAAVFYYAYGLFKVGVIAQQIYSRYARGLTRDPRFAALDRAVAALGSAGMRAVRRGRIGGLD